MAERLHDRAQPQVVRAEVVAPLGYAVRLVHDEQRHSRSRELADRLLASELLRRQEQELELIAQLREAARALLRARGPVERGGLPRELLLDPLDLVSLQGDQRRDHQRGARYQLPGQLVDGGLTRSGGHDHERVPPARRGLNRLELPGPKLLPAERLAREPLYARPADGATWTLLWHPARLPAAGGDTLAGGL